MNEVFIVSAKRTPIGGFLGSLSHLTAPELGAIAIRETLKPADASLAETVYMGNVLTANVGQSPARQAARLAGIPDTTDATTINKVCASGLKAVALGAQHIQLGQHDMVVTGGMESMSNTPHYALLRKNTKLGHAVFTDGILRDGLNDAYDGKHMGEAAEQCVVKYKLTRTQQDDYALRSYERANQATREGRFVHELISIMHPLTNTALTSDEDIYKIIPEKVSKLKPAFLPNGTITAANASNLNDGAAAVLLASQKSIDRHGLRPLAQAIAYADAALEPSWFTMAPSVAIGKVLKQAGLSIGDIDLFEINEAYAAVILANSMELGIDMEKINIYGGAVAMGHPIGASGARILCTLTHALAQTNKKYGIAAICNGGGGSTAMLIENKTL